MSANQVSIPLMLLMVPLLMGWLVGCTGFGGPQAAVPDDPDPWRVSVGGAYVASLSWTVDSDRVPIGSSDPRLTFEKLEGVAAMPAVVRGPHKLALNYTSVDGVDQATGAEGRYDAVVATAMVGLYVFERGDLKLPFRIGLGVGGGRVEAGQDYVDESGAIGAMACELELEMLDHFSVLVRAEALVLGDPGDTEAWGSALYLGGALTF